MPRIVAPPLVVVDAISGIKVKPRNRVVDVLNHAPNQFPIPQLHRIQHSCTSFVWLDLLFTININLLADINNKQLITAWW